MFFRYFGGNSRPTASHGIYETRHLRPYICSPMRAAAIFGLGTSTAKLQDFRAEGSAEWIEGVPTCSSDADAIVIFGGDGTIHRHLPALVRLQLPVLVVPSGSGNDFARPLHL